MNNARQNMYLVRAVARHFSKSAPKASETVNPRFHEMKKIQQKFGTDDGTPVYLKGGRGDKILYQGTALLTLLGLGLSVEVFYKLAFK